MFKGCRFCENVSKKYLELVNGLSLDQVLRKSGILPKTVRKENGTILRRICCLDLQKVDIPSSVEGINPAPHIHEQMATSNYVQMSTTLRTPLRITNITLEHNAMNNKNTIAHMDVHNTQY